MIRTCILGIAVMFAVSCTDQSDGSNANDSGARDLATHLSNVYIAPEASVAEMFTHIEGDAESLFFAASEGNVICESIAAITQEGTMHTLYEGRIELGDEVRAVFPDAATDIRRIRFECRTDNPLRAKLDIAVETSA